MSKFDELQAKKAEYEKLIQKDGEVAVKELFNEIFAAYPKLEAVRWSQYTPYFADGDALIFRVNDLEVKFKEVKDGKVRCIKSKCKVEIGSVAFCPQCGTEQPDSSERQKAEDEQDFQENYGLEDKSLKQAIINLDRTFRSMEDVMLAIFGDHARITATRDEITVEEYSHD